MTENSRVIKVLVASPGDVEKERDIAKEVIAEWHIRHPYDGLMLEPVLWETHGAPESGKRTQEVLNPLVDSCDMAIGIFWTRIGTPTGVAAGGAVEEVQRFIDRKKLVMLYFSLRSIPRKGIDHEQIRQLDEFRAVMQPNGLTWEYNEHNEFERELARHLDIQIPKWFGKGGGFDSAQPPTDIDPAAQLERYEAALKRELDAVNLPGSPAIESFALKLSDTFVSFASPKCSVASVSTKNPRRHASRRQNLHVTVRLKR